MNINEALDAIKNVIEKYNHDDYPLISQSINEFVGKGVPRGCYQNYVVVADIISILTIFETYLKEMK